MTRSDGRPSLWCVIISLLTWLLCAALQAAVLAWLAGRIVTDRWEWSQWLWWIPTPAALAAAVLVLIVLLARRPCVKSSRPMLALGAAQFLGIGAFFTFFEHRLLAGPPESPQGVLVMHWNWTHTVPHHVDLHVDQILAQRPDIAFMTDGQRLRRSRSERERLDAWHIEGVSVFTILSRWPVLRARPIVAREPTHVAIVEIDTTASLGRTTTFLLVNMPSELEIGRMEHMRNVRAMMDSADMPPIDIALGDFNVPRGSASLETFVPGFHHAYQDAGHGYAATFYRPFPLYHIDHVLLSEHVAATDYFVIDAGFGRHRAQLARFALTNVRHAGAAAP